MQSNNPCKPSEFFKGQTYADEYLCSLADRVGVRISTIGNNRCMVTMPGAVESQEYATAVSGYGIYTTVAMLGLAYVRGMGIER